MEAAYQYQLLERIGIGGMAEIYRAVAVGSGSASGSVVCVKRILPHLSEDPEYREMFLDEARVASSLNHPNLVQVLDLGRIDDHLFLALEFVDGADLREVLVRARKAGIRPPPGAILHVALEVLRGLHYAHSRLTADGSPMAIVHRDVSPGNVLVSRGGAVKLGDFGIARAAVRAGRTVAGVVKGNALYMAPEQITGGAMDARTDVYGAGLLLLTLLCGYHPHERESLPRLIDHAVNAEVPNPSTFDPALPPELDEIVARATELDPNRRFQSAQEFGIALESFAKAKGIAPGPDLLAEFLTPLLVSETHELPPLVVGRPVTFVGPLDQIGGQEPPEEHREPTITLDTRNDATHRIAEPQLPVSQLPVPSEEELFQPREVHERTIVSGARALPPEGSAEGSAELDHTRVSVSQLPVEDSIRPLGPETGALTLSELGLESESPKTPVLVGAITRTNFNPLPAPPERPSRLRLGASPTPANHPAPTPAVAPAPAAPFPTASDVDLQGTGTNKTSGSRQAIAGVAFAGETTAISSGLDQAVRLWDLAAGKEIRSWRAHSAAVITLVVSRDRTLALTGSRDRTLRLWDIQGGTLRRSFSGHDGWVFAAAIGADNRRFLSGGQDRTIRLWDDSRPEAEAVLQGHTDTVSAVVLFPDGKRAMSGSYDRTLRTWDLESRTQIRSMDAPESVRAIALSADGRTALSAGADSCVTRWDVESGTALATFRGHREPVVTVALSPDGRFALSGSYDATARLWDMESGRSRAVLRGHTDPVTSVVFSADGTRALTGSGDGTVRSWKLPS